MLRLLCLLLLPGLAAGLQAAEQSRPASVEEIALFKDAMRRSVQETERWAYTEITRSSATMGRMPPEAVVRFDPSKPYAEQFTPLQIDGKPPTERQRDDYRKRGERRGERVARAAEAARNPGAMRPPPSLKIGGVSVIPDIEHPGFVREENGRVEFEVPVQSTRKDIPIEKFQVLVWVNRESRLVESVALRVRESFRLKLIAKIKAGEVGMNFTVIDPKFAPVISAMSGDVSASVLLMSVTGTFERNRTEWRRVTPYDERFEVKLGPLRTLDF